jgi:hypothetical protein
MSEPPFDLPDQQWLAEQGSHHESAARYHAGEPARDQTERDYYQVLAEDQAAAEEAEAHERHFYVLPGSSQLPQHDQCAPETGGCPWKSPAENQADLELWHRTEEQAAQANAELYGEPEAGA